MARITSGITLLVSLIFSYVFLESVIANKTQFCDNYSVCLDRLESKRRECNRFLPDEFSIRRAKKGEKVEDQCTRRKHNTIHQELANLHLRHSELLRDCVGKNIQKAQAVTNTAKANKCLSAYDKLITFSELLQQEVATTRGPKRVNAKKERTLKRNSKRKEANKQSAKLCKRTKKGLIKKCSQMAKCCSVTRECHQEVSPIDSQITVLRAELKSPKCK